MTEPSGILSRPGALDLEEEEFDRVRRPRDLQPRPAKGSVLDLRALVIGTMIPFSSRPRRGVPAAAAAAASTSTQVRRHSVDGDLAAGLADPASAISGSK
jgi:hypothetical protein